MRPLQVPSHADQAPLALNSFNATQVELPESKGGLDDPENRLVRQLALRISPFPLGRAHPVRHAFNSVTIILMLTTCSMPPSGYYSGAYCCRFLIRWACPPDQSISLETGDYSLGIDIRNLNEFEASQLPPVFREQAGSLTKYWLEGGEVRRCEFPMGELSKSREGSGERISAPETLLSATRERFGDLLVTLVTETGWPAPDLNSRCRPGLVKERRRFTLRQGVQRIDHVQNLICLRRIHPNFL